MLDVSGLDKQAHVDHNFSQEERVFLRTTNIIKRLNKEFCRRTRPLEILAGESSCCARPAFIALKMELHWVANLFEKAAQNLTLLNRL